MATRHALCSVDDGGTGGTVWHLQIQAQSSGIQLESHDLKPHPTQDGKGERGSDAFWWPQDECADALKLPELCTIWLLSGLIEGRHFA